MPPLVGGIDSKYTVLYIQKISGFNKELTQLQPILSSPRGFGKQNPGPVPGWLVQAGGPEKKKFDPSAYRVQNTILTTLMSSQLSKML